MDILDVLTNLTQGQVLLICLVAFAATLIFPRLIRMRKLARLRYEKLRQGKPLTAKDMEWEKRQPYTHNGRRSEIEELLVKLKPFAKLNGMRIVFPGMVKHGGKCARSTMLLVGKFGILAIHCYGFGGRISVSSSGASWTQQINGKQRRLDNPVQIMQEDRALISGALSERGFDGIAIRSAAVFTCNDVVLMTGKVRHVYDRKEFLNWVLNETELLKDQHVDVEAVTKTLVALVKDSGAEEKESESL